MLRGVETLDRRSVMLDSMIGRYVVRRIWIYIRGGRFGDRLRASCSCIPNNLEGGEVSVLLSAVPAEQWKCDSVGPRLVAYRARSG